MKESFNQAPNCPYGNFDQPSNKTWKIVNIKVLILTVILFFSAAGFSQAATFTVTKVADTDDGVCDTDCSLREAISAANTAGTNDTIAFDSSVFATPQIISLSGTELTVEDNGTLIINGTGSTFLDISGFISDPIFAQSRVFYIAPSANLTLNNLTVSDGDSEGAVSNGFGGGIFSDFATLTINNCTVRNNNSLLEGGGGIYMRFGTLNVNNSSIRNNNAISGGGIFNDQGDLFITNSQISSNTARIFGGGGVENTGNLTVNESTFFANRVTSADQGGGGIDNMSTANITNSTFSQNSATAFGGGIHNTGNLDLVSSTIAYNNVTFETGIGGGINNDAGGNVDARNTIVGRNVRGSDAYNDPNAVPSDFAGTLNSQGYNLIENTSTITISGTTTGNILNVDPLLSLFVSAYGGPTRTHALKQNSPAIDAGDPNNSPAADQRGFPRPIDGDGNGSALPDIGAYETSRVTTPSTFTVTNTNDVGAGSLRQAIETSNATFSSDTINFDPGVFSTPQAISVIDSSLEIAPGSNVVINGPGANLVNISSNRQNINFYVNTSATAEINGLTVSEGLLGIYNFGTLTLNNLIVRDNGTNGGIYGIGTTTINNSVIKNNEGRGSGAGVQNDLIMTINNSTISDNTLFGTSSSSSCGGGVANRFGTMTITNSTIKNNSTTNNNRGGGGFCNSLGGQSHLTNVTITGNSAISGGGILNDGSSLNITNSTVAINTADGEGGGVFNNASFGSSTLNSANSIFANNTAQTSPDFGGILTSQGYNLVADITGTTIEGDTTGNITGINPQLDPDGVKNNGGATETIALTANSPAIDAADPNNFPVTDQRGLPRPFDGDRNGSALPDIGAFEFSEQDFDARARFDMDGDGKTDIGVWRPGPGQWWYLRSSDEVAKAFQFGETSDVIAPADFTGDGATDIAFFRPSSGQWFVLRSEDSSFFAFNFGTNGDVPVPADYDGDGKADAAIFRPSSSTWFIIKSSDSNVIIQQFGLDGDIPIVEDYDGDHKADLAVFRPSESQWFFQRSTDLVVKGFQFGTPGDTTPAPADFTGDGKADIAFFKPSATGGANNWFILRSDDDSFYAFPFGVSTDIPVPGDYDGDGKADPAVFRPSNFTWYLERSTAGFTAIFFGIADDVPIPAAYIP
jgi:CSLREA domain-containing protein